jgi:hypothetical protein
MSMTNRTRLPRATHPQAHAILGAMSGILRGGSGRLSATDRETLVGAHRWIFAQREALDVEALASVEPEELAAALDDPELRAHAVRLLAVCAFVAGALDRTKLSSVLAFARALEVHESYVDEIAALAQDRLRWAMADMNRRNVESILHRPWAGGDVDAWLLPYRGADADPALAARYEALAALPPPTLGHAFWRHFRENGYAFPGGPDALNEAFSTPHDATHVLSGYDTSYQGELLVSTFTAAMHDEEPMAGHVLPVILTWHLGLQFNEKATAATGWLAPEKLWVAWERGASTTCDVFAAEWDFWSAAEASVDDLRERYGIPPLDPAHAAAGPSPRRGATRAPLRDPSS